MKKYLDRGFWIAKHFYWQSLFHYAINSIRFKSFTFFSVCNPGIDLGGMLYDRKTDIYDFLPDHVLPFTAIVKDIKEAQSYFDLGKLKFPVIVKPNVGYKGYKVQKVTDIQRLKKFFAEENTLDREWLIQEFLNQKKEFSVGYYRFPQSKGDGIFTVVEKVYPTIEGDGKSTIEVLIKNLNNPFLNQDIISAKHGHRFDEVLPQGSPLVLDEIGNYVRGAKFLSHFGYRSEDMTKTMQRLVEHTDGINFFRLDLKSDSLDDIIKGNFKVMELNGMKSEPLHIYDSKSKFFSNYKTIKNHWKIISQIVEEQLNLQKSTPTFGDGIRSLISIKKLVR